MAVSCGVAVLWRSVGKTHVNFGLVGLFLPRSSSTVPGLAPVATVTTCSLEGLSCRT